MKIPKPRSTPKPRPGAEAFPGADVPAAPGAGGIALRAGGVQAQPLSAGQKRFNQLLQRIDKLKAQIADTQALADTYRPLYASTLAPLQAQHRAAMRRMALQLDERLGRKGLTPAQKNALADIVCALSGELAAAGDADMAALHDRHSAQSLRALQEQEAAGLRAMMKDVLGERLDVDLEDESLDPQVRLEAMMRAAREHQAHQEEEAQRRQAARARKRSPGAAQARAVRQQEDARAMLRQVYRQLASALHPDREPDPAERQRKTALMSQANAAYGQQDLVTLLHIQQRIGQLAPGAACEMPEARIAAMTTLLKQQAAELEGEMLGRQEQLRQAFNLDFYQQPTDASLRQRLALEAQDMRDALAQMEEDLLMVRDDAGLKRWLKLQKQLARQVDFF